MMFSFPMIFILVGLLQQQEGPAQTGAYFAAGYIVIFGVMALYLASLAIRRRNMQQDLEALDQVQEKSREQTNTGTHPSKA